MNLNKITLKITGGIELEQDVVAGHDLDVSMPVSVYSKAYNDCQDGTFDVVYKAKPCGKIDVLQGEIRLPAKGKGKTSKKVRDFIYYQGEAYQIVDHEGFYEEVMRIFRADSKYVDQIVSKIDIEKYR